MTAGIRATVEFETAAVCPVARFASETGASVDSVSTSVATPGDGGSVTEILLSVEGPPEPAGLDHVFTSGSTHLFRRAHDGDDPCPCECLGEFGCPVDGYAVRDGRLTLGFYATDYEQLRAAVAALREHWPDVDVRRLVRSPTPDPPEETVLVDRGKLTDRQLEVVATAFEMGYFERPRRANATEVAAELGIDPSTVTEHLSVALGKLLADVLEAGAGR